MPNELPSENKDLPTYLHCIINKGLWTIRQYIFRVSPNPTAPINDPTNANPPIFISNQNPAEELLFRMELLFCNISCVKDLPLEI